MLDAERSGNWDTVSSSKAPALLISQLKHRHAPEPPAEEAQLKSRIMQRILVNDAEIRHPPNSRLDQLDELLAGRTKTVHRPVPGHRHGNPADAAGVAVRQQWRLDEFPASPRRARSSRCSSQFQDGNLLLNLNGSNGAMLSTTLWSLDPTRGQLSFSADALRR